MAHTKAQSSSKNLKDSAGQRLGVKKFGGEKVVAGNIIIRQRGNKYFAGEGVRMGRDHTLFAAIDGIVQFYRKAQIKFNGRRYENRFVKVETVK
ncbi:MAG: 50S ribosomal protein L27 [Patescibacteria group bacterium]|nr:50S ribosomal protein L27 [Patescibacteria group bacterium]